MSNHGWINYDEQKPPDGSTVLVLFENERHGSRFAIYSSMKSSNGYMVVVSGLFLFDLSTKIVAWRRLDEIEMSIPLEYMEKRTENV